MWTGAILAGGQSRRLGGLNKASLTLGHPSSNADSSAQAPTLLARQLAQLGRIVPRTIIIASNQEAFRDAGVPVIPDLRPGAGALGALYTAVHSAGTDRTLVMACDMPFVSERLLRYLVDAGVAADIVIPRTTRGYEPLCATYSRRSEAALGRLVEDGCFKLSEVARLPGLAIREIGPDELLQFGSESELFFNINTPDDYARAIELDGEYRSLGG